MLIFAGQFPPILQQFKSFSPGNRILESGGKEKFMHARGQFFCAITEKYYYKINLKYINFLLFWAKTDKMTPSVIFRDGKEFIQIFIAKIDGSTVLGNKNIQKK